MNTLNLLGDVASFFGGIILLTHFTGIYSFALEGEELILSVLLFYMSAYICKAISQLVSRG